MIDWKNPDFGAIHKERLTRLTRLRADPVAMHAARIFYAANPHYFISDWGITVDPRVEARGRSPFMPFILFPKQIELIEWMMARYRSGEPGIVVKSRDVGASWCAMALGVTLCIFRKRMVIGVGSATEVKLDRSGDTGTLFYKANEFIRYLPPEFRGGWDEKKHSNYMRISFPETKSSLTGEAGDNIGRGGRTGIFFVDESAHIERPALVDASLAATTECRIDLSSVNGSANSFAEKARGGKIPRFDFGWRDDPRKDDLWYAKQAERLDPITLAQEIDCNFSASTEGVIIPQVWVQAAVDAHKKLNLPILGAKRGALDVADAGADKNAFAARHGNVLTHIESWSGKNSDIYATTERAYMLCDTLELTDFYYDNDGLGAGVTGDARVIAERRKNQGARPIQVMSFRGSAAVNFPDNEMVKGRKNDEFFANLKAQSWWHLRFMFQETWRAVSGVKYDPDMVISLSSGMKELSRLLIELSQPVYKINNAGKILVDKQPEGTASPNLADAVMMLFSPQPRAMRISAEALERSRRVG